MKNLLSENMMRFGTKNLSEAAQKELVVKSIMETINQHGLHAEVSNALTEADAPKPNAWIKMASGWDVNYKVHPNSDPWEQPLVIQSPSSLGEAQKIIGTIMKLIGTGKAEDPAMINTIKQITANNYPAILWTVRYGTKFKGLTKSRGYDSVCDWLGNHVDRPTQGGSSNNTPGQWGGGKGLVGTVRDAIMGVKTGQFISSYLKKFNGGEHMSVEY